MLRSIQSPHSERQEKDQRAARLQEGVEAVKTLPKKQRDEILRAFWALRAGTAERRRRLTALAEEQIKEAEELNAVIHADMKSDIGTSPTGLYELVGEYNLVPQSISCSEG